MGRYSTEFKVGLFTVVAVAVLSFFLLSTRDAPFKPGGAYDLYTVAPSAEGIAFGNMVLLAGVRVGRVGEITLTPEGKARITLEIERQVQLPVDSKVTMKSMGLLGDKSVVLLPGQKDTLLRPGDTIQYTVPEGDLDQLTRQLSDVAVDVKKITGDLKDITGRVREDVDIGKIDASIERILKNLEAFSGTLKQIGGANQDDLSRIVSNIRDVSQSLKDLLDTSRSVIEGSGKQVSDQIATLQAATARLDEVLASVGKITGKVEAGEGTVGALLNERTTVDNLNDAITGATELLDRVNRFKTTIAYQGDYYALAPEGLQGSVKNTLTVTLANRPDYYYTFALVSDPVLDSTVKVVVSDSPYYNRQERVYTDAYQLTFQFARRWKDLALRLGIRENHGGVGADYYLWKDRIALSADLYDFSPYGAAVASGDAINLLNGRQPNLELKARFGIYNHLYLSAGVDDVLNRYTQRADGSPVNLMIGGGFSFQDDDLKFLLSYLPIPK